MYVCMCGWMAKVYGYKRGPQHTTFGIDVFIILVFELCFCFSHPIIVAVVVLFFGFSACLFACCSLLCLWLNSLECPVRVRAFVVRPYQMYLIHTTDSIQLANLISLSIAVVAKGRGQNHFILHIQRVDHCTFAVFSTHTHSPCIPRKVQVRSAPIC